jgi:uncharacterized repeat protein (TIGR01451 family)
VEGLESRQLLASNATLTLTSAIPALPAAGGTHQVAQNGFVQYTFTISNPAVPANTAGPATITFSDPLPAGLTLLNATSTKGTVSTADNTATVDVGTVNPGAADVVVTVQAEPTGTVGSTFTNTATITAPEGVGTPSTASLTSTVVASTLTVQAQATPNPLLFVPGSAASPELDYIFTVTNTGTAAATNVTVAAAQIPQEVTLQFVNTTSGTATGNMFPVTIPSLAAGATARIIAVTHVKPGTAVPTLQPFIVTATSTQPPALGQVAAALAFPPVQAVLPPPKVISLSRFGIHRQVTSIVIGFSEALNPATAQDPGNYRVTLVGPNSAVPIRSAVYDPTHRTVTLNLAQRITSASQPIRIVVNGASPTGVANLAGTRLDGAGTGKAGSNFVRVFRGVGPGTFGTPVA